MFLHFRGQLKDELHGMTYLMELVDYVIKEASGDSDYQGAVGGVHTPLNLSNQQVCFSALSHFPDMFYKDSLKC